MSPLMLLLIEAGGFGRSEARPEDSGSVPCPILERVTGRHLGNGPVSAERQPMCHHTYSLGPVGTCHEMPGTWWLLNGRNLSLTVWEVAA